MVSEDQQKFGEGESDSVTVICVPLGIVCPRTHFPSDICSPERISLAYFATLASVIYVSQG